MKFLILVALKLLTNIYKLVIGPFTVFSVNFDQNCFIKSTPERRSAEFPRIPAPRRGPSPSRPRVPTSSGRPRTGTGLRSGIRSRARVFGCLGSVTRLRQRCTRQRLRPFGRRYRPGDALLYLLILLINFTYYIFTY
jgi:hypothetical protein